jgi:prolyl-tRNA synthetase
MFLRTTEFLWQEGHTAHATEQEAWEETRQMLEVYAAFAEQHMAMPVIKGEKTADERFPGAVSTLTIEAMMQDRKALQAGTSHFLGQNFSKAQDIKFQDQNGTEVFAWTTSWGVSTRLVGALIMTHSDDDGLVLPPRLAPKHIVLLPIYRSDEERAQVLDYCHQLKAELQQQTVFDKPIQVLLDDRDLRGGEKNWQHVKRGVPLRAEIGPKDIAKNAVFLSQRDTGEKQSYDRGQFVAHASRLLEAMQQRLYDKALQLRRDNTRPIDDLEEFRQFFTPQNKKKPEIHGGFASSHWCEEATDNELLKQLKVTVRCIPLEGDEEPGKCLFTGKPSRRRVIFGKAY